MILVRLVWGESFFFYVNKNEFAKKYHQTTVFLSLLAVEMSELNAFSHFNIKEMNILILSSIREGS